MLEWGDLTELRLLRVERVAVYDFVRAYFKDYTAYGQFTNCWAASHIRQFYTRHFTERPF